MYFNEICVLFALVHLLEGGISHLKREVKHIDSNKLDGIAIATEVNKMTSRSFLECANLCRQTDTCLSIFYKDNQCWFIRAGVRFSSNSCFQFKSGSTTAFVGLNEVCLITNEPRYVFGVCDKAAWKIESLGTQCTVQIDLCPASTSLQCVSIGYQNNTCPVAGVGRIFSVEVKQQQSNSPCVYDTSFGYTGNYVWVDEGCRAIFLVCYLAVV